MDSKAGLLAGFGIWLLLLLEVAPACAQEKHESGDHSLLQERSYSMGLGVPWSFHFESIGINARGYYNIGNQFCFGPEFYYLQTDHAEVFDVDLIAHYIFNTPWVGVYPVGGANYTVEWKETDKSGTKQEDAFGATFGIGIHRHVGAFTAFAEYTRVENKFGDAFITVGLLYTVHPDGH